LVGPTGKVIAVDLQQKMLDVMGSRARRAGLSDRISPHLCRADDIGIAVSAEFILAFWMVHELPDQENFFKQLKTGLAADGKILVAEPKMHVTAEAFEKTLDIAQSCGLLCIERPDIRFSRTALLRTGASGI
jgi:ubiquinone/menaquinone biosynthesis C-methylase UbiE